MFERQECKNVYIPSYTKCVSDKCIPLWMSDVTLISMQCRNDMCDLFVMKYQKVQLKAH